MRAILVLFAASQLWATNTYYISKSTGSDSYTSTQAQSKSTPWAHFRGMASCSSNCASYTPVAGDTFVLMGGDTWVNSDFPILWKWSGTAGSRITIGVDPTWYTGAAWARPIFDAQKATINGGAVVGNVMFQAGPYLSSATSYVTLDSIEMKGLYSPDKGSSGKLSYIQCNTNPCHYWTFNNIYIHGWSVATDGHCVLVLLPGPLGVGDAFTNGIIDGSDRTDAIPYTGSDTYHSGATGTCSALFHLPDRVTGNVIHDVPNAIVGEIQVAGPAGLEIGSNLIYNIIKTNNPAETHENAIETTDVHGGTYYIHDNVIHDIFYGESMMLGNSNETDYVWNNVIYNMSQTWPPSWPQNNGFTNMAVYAWNNTIVPAAATQCFTLSGYAGKFTSVTIQNNHCISTSATIAPASWNGTAATIDHNSLMTPTDTASFGYTSSQTFAYSPISGSVPTVRVGINLSSNCSGSLASICSGTGYACAYDAKSKSVICPARMPPVARPASGAWDIGAYVGALQPPTSLQVTVR